MADVKWIKLSVNTFDDEKIKLIRALPEGNALIVIWCQLLCLAGKVNDNGYIYIGQNMPYTDEMLATIFNEPVNNVRLAIQTFERFGMVESTEHGLYLVNWGVYQNLEGLEKVRENGRLRVEKYRAAQKLLDVTPAKDDVTLRNVTVTPLERRDKNKKEEEDIDTTPNPPTKGKPHTKTVDKSAYAERVRMTEAEHATLTAELGEEGAAWCVQKLDTYKGSTGRVYKSDYLAIKSWVINEYIKQSAAPVRQVGAPAPVPAASLPKVKRWTAQRRVFDAKGRRSTEVYPGCFMTEAQAREWAGPDGEVESTEVQADYTQKAGGGPGEAVKGIAEGWRVN